MKAFAKATLNLGGTRGETMILTHLLEVRLPRRSRLLAQICTKDVKLDGLNRPAGDPF